MDKSQNAVVQVFVNAAYFNWAQPHLSPSQGESFGTAFFIDDAGHLVTNFHIIAEAASIHIQVPTLGKEQFDVEVVGVCPDRDIALMKLTSEALEKIKKFVPAIPKLELGESDATVRMQEIVALGYPLGQDVLKSTQGVISGRQEVLGASFIQITAALNPGNSGGPCLDVNGKVIGINTAIIPDAQSIGYIIPMSDVKGVIEDLYNVKLLRSPLLGCELNYGSFDMLAYLGNPEPGGLYVARVYENTLFSRAGVVEGDMIYQLNENVFDMYGEAKVDWAEDKVSITTLLGRLRIGQPVTIVMYRKGERKEITFNFDTQEPLPVRTVYPEYEEVNAEIVGGVVIMELTTNHVMQFLEFNPFLVKYRQRENLERPRLVIASVLPGSLAQQTRTLYTGDIIDEVNGLKATTLEQFRHLVGQTKDFLTIKTENKKFVVFSYDKIQKEQEFLAGEIEGRRGSH